MVEKLPQPKDTGARKKTADSVSSGYIGIVNVYQLIPKGGKPVNLAEAGIIVPPNVPRLPQPPAPSELKMSKKEEKKMKDEMASQVAVKYAMEKDKHDKVFRIRVYGGGQPSNFIEDVGSYDRILQKHPSLAKQYDINKPEDRKIINKAVHIIKTNKTDKEKALGRQAMRLGVRVQTMREWVASNLERPVLNAPEVYKKYERAERQELAEKEQEQHLREEMEQFEKPVQPKIIEVPTQQQLPLDLDTISKISSAEANIPGKYKKLSTVNEIKQANPSYVKYVDRGNNNIEYFVQIGNVERKRKYQLIKMDRKKPRLIFRIRRKSLKVIKSKVIKKNLLRKIQIKMKPKIRPGRRK